MKRISTEIEVNASPERVWQVLTDFQALPDWNPFMQRAEGELRAGERLSVRLQVPGGMGMTIKPELLKVEPNRELRWLGHLLVTGLFDGEHIFEIEPLEGDRVRFVQREVFTGVLVPLFAIMGVFRGTLRGFHAMNVALKERSEQALDQ